jgi:hypothetical protein
MSKRSESSGHLLNSTLSDEAQFIPLNLGFIVGDIAISSKFTLALSTEGSFDLWDFSKVGHVEEAAESDEQGREDQLSVVRRD